MRCSKDKSNYWSDHHLALLLYTAQRVLQILPTPNVEISDLVAIGWQYSLRKRPADMLHNCFPILRNIMFSYLRRENAALNPDPDVALAEIQDRYDLFDIADAKMDYEELMSMLTKEQQSILKERSAGMTLRDIGRRHGCSYEQIRLRQNAAFDKLQMVCR